MQKVIPTEGRIPSLEAIRSDQLEGADLILYTNDLTPDKDTVLADLTEAAWAGYAAVTLTGWTSPIDNAAGDAITVSPIATFDNTSGSDQDAYGYAVVKGGVCLLVSRFPSAPATLPDLVPFPVEIVYEFTSP